MNPYEILGVPRDADLAQIRKAYRTRAKTAHPDMGGDPVAFDLLKSATELLMDPERRKAFDETGAWQERQPDNQHKALFTLLASAFDQVLNEVQDPSRIDFVLEMSKRLGERRNNIALGRRELPAILAKLRKMRGRFQRKRKHKDDPNHLESLVNSRIEAVTAQLKRIEEEDELTLQVMKLLDTFSFMVDMDVPSITQEQLMMAMAYAMQSGFTPPRR